MTTTSIVRPSLTQITHYLRPGYTDAYSVTAYGYYSTTKSDTVRRHWVPSGPYVDMYNGTGLTRTLQDRVDALYTWEQPGVVRYTRSVVGDSGLGWAGSSVRTNDQSVRIANQLRSQIKGEAVNLANMLGEYRQAASLFGDAAFKVFTLVQAVRKRDPRILMHEFYSPRGRLRKEIPRRLRRKLSGEYLSFMYGVKPLMQDMHQAMLDMKGRLTDRPPLLKLDARVPQTSSWQTKWYCPLNSRQDGRKTHLERRVDKGRAYVLLRNDILLNSLGAYGFTNPLSVAWELMPFSFVVDWWLNVGDVLSSLDNCLYVQASVWQLTTKYEYRCLSEIYGVGATYVLNEYTRSTPASLATASSLAYKPSLSLTHVANGTALLLRLR